MDNEDTTPADRRETDARETAPEVAGKKAPPPPPSNMLQAGGKKQAPLDWSDCDD